MRLPRRVCALSVSRSPRRVQKQGFGDIGGPNSKLTSPPHIRQPSGPAIGPVRGHRAAFPEPAGSSLASGLLAVGSFEFPDPYRHRMRTTQFTSPPLLARSEKRIWVILHEVSAGTTPAPLWAGRWILRTSFFPEGKDAFRKERTIVSRSTMLSSRKGPWFSVHDPFLQESAIAFRSLILSRKKASWFSIPRFFPPGKPSISLMARLRRG